MRQRDIALKSNPNRPLKEIREYAEKVNTLIQLKNLMTYPLVKERVESGQLILRAWHYNIRTGKILEFDTRIDSFIPLEELDEKAS